MRTVLIWAQIANQLRLVLHIAAYWPMLTLRDAIRRRMHVERFRVTLNGLGGFHLGNPGRMTSSLIPIAIAGALFVPLAGCDGRSAVTSSMVDSMPVSPDRGDTTAALVGAPANHGLEPMERITVSPGHTEKQGHVEISCPADGLACVVSVAMDGRVEYEKTGGLPSVMLDRPAPGDVVVILKGIQENSNSPALARHAARGPSPGQVTCKALTIDCEGGPGPVHFRTIPQFDYSGFEFVEHRRGVTLAQDLRVFREGKSAVGYRALAGWLDHSYFLIATAGASTASDEHQINSRYYSAYSIGNPTHSNPDVAVGGTAKWSGVMFGNRTSDPNTFIEGNADITVSNLAGYPLVDVEFSNITNAQTQTSIENMVWNGLKLKDGSFGLEPVDSAASHVSRHPASIGISGRFYGPDHDEVGGLFSYTRQDSGSGRPFPPITYSGAFGGKRK
ncbi:MAG: hypothetical protein OXF79_09120 [Chloroflexi bacterium]|nr:hypothetical protein [Chloroflexota bacterium]